MKINVFDPSPDVRNEWQAATQPVGLVLCWFGELSQLDEALQDEVGLTVIDQALLADEFCREFGRICQRYPKQRVLLTGHELSVGDAVEAMRLGACYVFEKPFGQNMVSTALPQIMEQASKLQEAESEYRRISQLFDDLTQREKRVLDLVLKGVPNRETAEQLQVSVRTVEARRAKVYSKLECENLVQLVRRVEQLEHLRRQFSRPDQPSQSGHPLAGHRPNFLQRCASSVDELRASEI